MSISGITPGLEDRYLVSEAATLIGKSADTLRRWDKQGILHPSEKEKFGKTTVRLYTPDDIKRGQEIARTLRPGRKRTGPESVGGRHGGEGTTGEQRSTA